MALVDTSSAGAKPVVFIHANAVQSIAAIVGAYSLTARAQRPTPSK